jgi:MerR family copper efflux transcriptional regulator
MTTGALARRAGMSVKAVREYADAGLIYSIGRTRSGYRLFEDEALWCVAMIHGLRGLGLTVAEIRALSGSAEPVGPRLGQLLDRARDRTAAKIEELKQILARIDDFEAAHRTELAGEVEFDTGDPRARA